ncbi:c-type cytochrome [Deinococcus puniceus]|uniref:Cytochrome c domain-containing protein n=1 Tax=Deinococcus puniceus TaxID=1182568 RepID=A0A172T6P5_9DEIO|nr:cytochrome c [Deinococcus puniceus]ANE42632.1 hypothetical protein SU48_01360 [Deinococcus puniceus]
MFRLPSLLALSLPALAVLIGATLPQAEAQEKTAAILSPTAAQTATAQIERGAVLYRLACAMCHGDELEGGSAEALAGEGFRATYRALPPRALSHLIDGLHGHLPPVSRQEALDVTAFVLDSNGLPLGKELVENGLDER